MAKLNKKSKPDPEANTLMTTAKTENPYVALRNLNLNFRNLSQQISVETDLLGRLEKQLEEAKGSESSLAIDIFSTLVDTKKEQIVALWEADRQMFVQSIKLAGIQLSSKQELILNTQIEDSLQVDEYYEYFIV